MTGLLNPETKALTFSSTPIDNQHIHGINNLMVDIVEGPEDGKVIL
jgi:hypothetical protein